MNRTFFKSVTAAVLIFAFAGVFGAAASGAADVAVSGDTAKDPEKILAIVNGEAIKEKDVDKLILMLGPQGANYDNEQGRIAILEEIVNSHLFALEGARKKLDETPEFKEVLADFTRQTLSRFAIEDAIKNETSNEDEAKRFYEGSPEQFTQPEEIHALHILLADDATSADKIALVQSELKKGTAFEDLAKANSIDPSAVQNGGDLGFFSKGMMVPEFENAAFALENPGDVSEPTRSQFGWHIIKLVEKRPESVVPFDTVKGQIIQYLVNEKRGIEYQVRLTTLKDEYKVEMLVSADVK
ncbi:peptidylprolyl isomerase [Synergistales bacterium]|nr:peptidylprolyl isomerase [Synergistales bacterium]